MAAPHVTGIVATLAKMFPLKTHLEIKDAVLNSVTKTSSLQGLVSTGGYANMTAAISVLMGFSIQTVESCHSPWRNAAGSRQRHAP